MIFIWHAGPRIERKRDHFVYRFAAKGIHQTKPIPARIYKIIEWDGSEGVFYELLWEDGDIWTIPGSLFTSLRSITKFLKQCGFDEVVTEKKWQVFRTN